MGDLRRGVARFGSFWVDVLRLPLDRLEMVTLVLESVAIRESNIWMRCGGGSDYRCTGLVWIFGWPGDLFGSSRESKCLDLLSCVCLDFCLLSSSSSCSCNLGSRRLPCLVNWLLCSCSREWGSFSVLLSLGDSPYLFVERKGSNLMLWLSYWLVVHEVIDI